MGSFINGEDSQYSPLFLSKIKPDSYSRRYNAVRADLEKIRLGVRLVVDELIQLAELRR